MGTIIILRPIFISKVYKGWLKSIRTLVAILNYVFNIRLLATCGKSINVYSRLVQQLIVQTVLAIFWHIIDWIIFQTSQFLFRSLTLKMFGSSNLFFGLIIVVLGCAYAMPQDSVLAEIGEILSSCSLIPGILNFIEFS